MKNTRQNGFTIMELLIIVAFFGLSISILVVIVSSLRLNNSDIQKLRDTKRLSDMNQLRTGLDLFLSQSGGYPDAEFWLTGGVISCGSSKLIQVPHDPLQPGSLYLYRNQGNNFTSKACGNKVWSDYSIQFKTETAILGSAGIHCLRPTKGIMSGACP